MSPTRFTRSVMILAAVTLPLGGCAKERSLEAVEKSGDKAYGAGNFDLARQEYQEYVDRRPGKARVQHALGLAYMALQQPQAAVQCFYIAHDISPSDEQYTADLAEALYLAGDRGKLYEFLRRMTQQPGTPADYIRLGQYAARLGDVDEAQTALLTAAKIDGGQTVGPQLALAAFYRTIGDRDRALERLRMASYIDPTNMEVDARIRELGEVPGPSYAIVPTEAR